MRFNFVYLYNACVSVELQVKCQNSIISQQINNAYSNTINVL